MGSLVNSSTIKIVFLFEYSPTKRDLERHGVMQLYEYGFEVFILDVSDILVNGTNSRKVFSLKKEITYFSCKSLWGTISVVKKIRPHFLFSLVYTKIVRRYFHRLILHNVLSQQAPIIEYRGPNGPFDRKVEDNLVKRIKSLVSNLIFGPLLFRNAAFSFIGGRKVLGNSTGQPIFAHSLDYDLYLESKSVPNPIRADPLPYLLFLDEDCVFHEDYKLLGMKSPVTAENYYSEVNFMLANLGEQLDLLPIIQVHPSADRKLAKKYYNFKLSNVETIHAVMNADLIVSHDSTALQFAVMCNKPVILLETTEIIASDYYHPQIQHFSKALGCSVMNLDDFSSEIGFPRICKESYAEYMEDYVKTNLSVEKFSYEILASFLLNAAKA